MMSTDHLETNEAVHTPALENSTTSHQPPKDFTGPRRLTIENYVVPDQNITPQEDFIADSKEFTDNGTNTLSIVARQRNREDGSQISERHSRDYTRIIRVHFCNELLELLHKLKDRAETPQVAGPASEVIKKLRDYDQYGDADPLRLLFSSLHDSLVSDDMWASCTPEQYAGIWEIIAKISRKQRVVLKSIEESVIALEDLGLNTTPFGIMDDWTETG